MVQVGQVESRELSSDGQFVSYGVFIKAPYDTLVNSQTRFWQMGNFSVDFDASGISLDMEPLAVLLSGGIAFDTPKHLQESGPAVPGSSFNRSQSRGLA